MNLIVKISQKFSMFECVGDWYNTVGSQIMNNLESLFKQMKAASVAAAIPIVSGLSDSVLSLLQSKPVQDGTIQFWTDSMQRMWKSYFIFVETYVSQKSVKDFLGWMSALLEAGFQHSDMVIRDVTVKFWDGTLAPAFDMDKTDIPQALKEAREKCILGKTDVSNVESEVTNKSSTEKDATNSVFTTEKVKYSSFI